MSDLCLSAFQRIFFVFLIESAALNLFVVRNNASIKSRISSPLFLLLVSEKALKQGMISGLLVIKDTEVLNSS